MIIDFYIKTNNDAHKTPDFDIIITNPTNSKTIKFIKKDINRKRKFNDTMSDIRYLLEGGEQFKPRDIGKILTILKKLREWVKENIIKKKPEITGDYYRKIYGKIDTSLESFTINDDEFDYIVKFDEIALENRRRRTTQKRRCENGDEITREKLERDIRRMYEKSLSFDNNNLRKQD